MNHKTQHTPKVTVCSGISVDGKLNYNKEATSKEFDACLVDEAFTPLETLRKKCDGVIVGVNTILTDNPHLLSNDNKNLHQIILDSTAKIDEKANVITDPRCNAVIVTTTRADKNKTRRLEENGAQVLICGDTHVDLPQTIRELLKYGLSTFLVEGGGKIIYSFLQEKLVDQLMLLTVPIMVGNKDAISLAEGTGFQQRIHLSLIHQEIIAKNYILATYKPIYE